MGAALVAAGCWVAVAACAQAVAGPAPAAVFVRDDKVASQRERYRSKQSLVVVSRSGTRAYDLLVYEDGEVLFEGHDCWFRSGFQAR